MTGTICSGKRSMTSLAILKTVGGSPCFHVACVASQPAPETEAGPVGLRALGDLPLGDLPLGDLPLGELPLGDLPLDDLPLGELPLGDLPGDLRPLALPFLLFEGSAPSEARTLSRRCFHWRSSAAHSVHLWSMRSCLRPLTDHRRSASAFISACGRQTVRHLQGLLPSAGTMVWTRHSSSGE